MWHCQREGLFSSNSCSMTWICLIKGGGVHFLFCAYIAQQFSVQLCS